MQPWKPVLILLMVLASLWFAPLEPAQAGEELPMAAPNASFSSEAKQYRVQEFKGRRVMLWLFSTWCSSCSAGLKAIAAQQPELRQAGFTILALRNHKNGDFEAGPSLMQFVDRYGPSVKAAPNWIFGEASEELGARYNPRNYPDIYFLIDEQGMIQAVNGAPAVTIDEIVRFARGG